MTQVLCWVLGNSGEKMWITEQRPLAKQSREMVIKNLQPNVTFRQDKSWEGETRGIKIDCNKVWNPFREGSACHFPEEASPWVSSEGRTGDSVQRSGKVIPCGANLCGRRGCGWSRESRVWDSNWQVSCGQMLPQKPSWDVMHFPQEQWGIGVFSCCSQLNSHIKCLLCINPVPLF